MIHNWFIFVTEIKNRAARRTVCRKMPSRMNKYTSFRLAQDGGSLYSSCLEVMLEVRCAVIFRSKIREQRLRRGGERSPRSVTSVETEVKGGVSDS